jgi:hypothetical protein
MGDEAILAQNIFGDLIPTAPTAPAPSATEDPIIRRADPYKAEDQAMQRDAAARAWAGEARAQEDQQLHRQQLELSRQSAERSATAATRADQNASRLTISDAENLQKKISAFGKLYNTARDFKPAYSHPGAGIENTLQAYSPIQVGTEGQRDWWSEFKAADNLVRNELFGASLSGGEKAAYGASAKEAGMNPAEVKRNIDRRVGEARGQLRRFVGSLEAGGYNKAQIDALLGEYGPIISGEAPVAEAEKAPADEPTPALGPATAAIAGGGTPPPPAPLSDNPSGNGPTPPVFSPGGPEMRANTSGVRNEDDPALSGVRAGYADLLTKSTEPAEVIGWLRDKGVTDPEVLRTAAAQAKFRRDNPDVPIESYNSKKSMIARCRRQTERN